MSKSKSKSESKSKTITVRKERYYPHPPEDVWVAENISFVTRCMMRVGWSYMLKKLIPRVLGNIESAVFTPGAIPLDKRCYKATNIPEKYIR